MNEWLDPKRYQRPAFSKAVESFKASGSQERITWAVVASAGSVTLLSVYYLVLDVLGRVYSLAWTLWYWGVWFKGLW